MAFIESLEPRTHLNGGAVDTSFGDNGTAVFDIRPVLQPGWSVLRRDKILAQDSGGRLYPMLESYDGVEFGAKQLVMSRLTRDGHLDTNFGTDGYRVLDRDPAQASFATPRSIVDANNRVHIFDGPYLWRLTPSGKIDLSFGRRGKIVIAAVADVDVAVGATFDANGRLYVYGASQGKIGPFRMVVARLTENGALDTTWAYGGAYKSPARGDGTSVAFARFLPDGDLMVAGSAGSDTGTWVTRLNPDGNVDTDYGDNGYFEYHFTPAENAYYFDSPLTILADGTVLGWVQSVSDDGPLNYSDNFKITPEGILESAFAILPQTGGEDAQSDTTFPLPDGRLMLIGPSAHLTRVLGDGTGRLDATWGTNGVTTSDDLAFEYQFVVAPDESVIASVLGGDADNFYLRRFWRDDAPLGQFDGRFIKRPRSTAVRFSVVWRDDEGVKQSSIDSSDIKVSGPFDGGSKTRNASLELVESLGGGAYRATYKITSSSGWTAADNGTYSVKLNSGQVEDVNGVAASARMLGTFRVKIG